MVEQIRSMATQGSTYKAMHTCTSVSYVTISKIIHHVGCYDDGKRSTLPSGAGRRLSPEQVCRIKELAENGARYKEIQQVTGVSSATIWKIVKRRSPLHVTES